MATLSLSEMLASILDSDDENDDFGALDSGYVKMTKALESQSILENSIFIWTGWQHCQK